jgi:hypothetical protein
MPSKIEAQALEFKPDVVRYMFLEIGPPIPDYAALV